MKLRAKALVLVVPLVVAPLLTLGWFGYTGLRATVEEKSLRELSTLLGQLSRRVRGVVDTADANARLFAGSGQLHRYLLTEDETDRYELLQPSLLRLLASYQDAYPEYPEIRVLFPDGYEDTRATLGALPNRTEDESASDWFSRIRDQGPPMVSLFTHHPELDRVVLLVVHRVELKDPAADPISGDPILRGFLAITVDFGFLEQVVRGTRIGEQGRIFATDEDGTVLFHPDATRVGTTLDPKYFGQLLESFGGRKAITTGPRGTAGFFAGEQPHPGLYLFGELPETEVLETTRVLAFTVAGVTLGTILVTAWLLFAGVQYLLIRPIQQLGSAAQQIGGGNLGVRLQRRTGDEIGALVEEFNAMAQALQASHRQRDKAQEEALRQGLELQKARLSRDFAEKEREVMRQAKEEAEEANRAKSQFLASMSHEIRTPMNGVLGLLELLGRSELTEHQRRLAELANGSARSLLDIINDVLDFSRIEAGRLRLNAREFDLRETAHGLEEFFAEPAARAGLGLDFAVADHLPSGLHGDPGRLRQVLVNLIGNAIKFTEHGTIEVRFTAAGRDGRRITVRCEVRDTGVGIPHKLQQDIFESFVQADGSSTRRFGGTGLGLAIAKQLVEMMGGRIGVESEPGRGSTFWFTVPLSVVAECASAQAMPAAPPGGGHGPQIAPLPSRRVLLAEDNPVNREVAVGMLEALGLTVAVAGNGLEALDLARRNAYDLALMDCMMPEIDGYEATRRLRAAEEHGNERRLPIVAMTANAMDGDRERCLDAGMDDYLAKPFTLQELQRVLVAWLTPLAERVDGAHRPGASSMCSSKL